MWLLEKEIKHPENDLKIRDALNKLNVPYFEIDKRAFETIKLEDLPTFNFDFVYGSVNILKDLLDKISGIYFNEDNFNYKSWAKHYKENLFNSPNESQITTVKDINMISFEDNKDYFIRPVKDLKSFSGQVVNKKELEVFIHEIKNSKYTDLNENIEIVIAPAYKIEKEWRCFVVDGKVSTASQYKNNGALEISRKNIPEEMIAFAEDMSKVWSPEKIFTLDICLSNKKFYIVEAQCSNTSGFYDCDIEKLVYDINEVCKYEKKPSRILRF